MTRAELVERMARDIHASDVARLQSYGDGLLPDFDVTSELVRMVSRQRATAALAAIEAAGCVVVPREAIRHIERLPDGAPQTSIEALQWISAAMEAHRLLAASPLAKERGA